MGTGQCHLRRGWEDGVLPSVFAEGTPATYLALHRELHLLSQLMPTAVLKGRTTAPLIKPPKHGATGDSPIVTLATSNSV